MVDMNLDQNIGSLTGKNGNKNVMAASLLIKFPFLLFVILHNKLIGKIDFNRKIFVFDEYKDYLNIFGITYILMDNIKNNL
jgi:hypothetical protein